MSAESEYLRIGIACYPTYGGSGVIATTLGTALAQRGHAIHFMSYENPIRLTEFHANVTYHPVTVRDYPLFKYPPYAMALATKMAEVADQHHLDVLHVHYAIPHAASAYLAREMIGRDRLRVVVTLHGTDITIVGHDPAYRRVTRFGISQADGVTAVSKYLEQQTRATFAIDRPIDVIPNFIDTARFTPRACEAALNLRQPGEMVVAHVSNFRPVKRVVDLVRAFARVVEEIPCRLLMVGDGPERPRAERLAAELGIADRTHFLGPQEAIEKILPCADLFVLPSRYESFGLAALEAMACGVPVLGSDAGGLPEVVEVGVTGDLCAVGDVTCLAEAMLRLLSDHERLARMGEAARRRSRERFDIDRIVPLYETHYRRVLEGAQAG